MTLDHEALIKKKQTEKRKTPVERFNRQVRQARALHLTVTGFETD